MLLCRVLTILDVNGIVLCRFLCMLEVLSKEKEKVWMGKFEDGNCTWEIGNDCTLVGTVGGQNCKNWGWGGVN